MSTQELLHLFPNSLPHLWRLTYARYKKQLLFRIKLSKRLANKNLRKWYRTQYFIQSAIQDIKIGVARNEDGVLGVSFISITLCFAMAAIASDILLSFFQTTLSLVDAYGFSMFIATGLSVSIFVLCMAWLAAFLLNSISLALTQGLHRTKHKSIRSTLSYGMYFSSRTVAAWVAYLLVMFIPVVMAAVVIATLLVQKVMSFDELLLALPYVIILASTWVVVIHMQYSLMPLIALYEPEKTFTQAFGRAHALVIGRGRVFTIFLTLIALVAGVIVYKVADILNTSLKIPFSMSMIFGISLIVIFWTLTMTVLFRKRKLARRAYV